MSSMARQPLGTFTTGRCQATKTIGRVVVGDHHPGRPDGVLPRVFDRTLDPLQVLASAGARTSRIRLGTNVLVMPWYHPVTLARTLASLDVLTNGGGTVEHEG